jgi:hypothetical protein
MDKQQKHHSTNPSSIFTKVFGVRNKVAHLEFYLLPRLMLMEYNGVSLDRAEVDKAYNNLKSLETRLKKDFYAATYPRVINPNSPQKLLPYLRTGELGKFGFTRPDGKDHFLKDITSTDKE